MLYLDESGGVTETDQSYYVLGGVSVHERKPFFLSKDLDDLQKRWFPASTDPIEFHASHVRNGKGEPWQSMSKQDRLKLLNEMAEILTATADTTVSLFAVALHKASHPHQDPISRTCEEIAGHFDATLTRIETEHHTKERGLMIFDQTAHQKTLHSLVAEYRSTGASWGGKVKHLAEIPMFTDSKLTRMLQWADFVAYSVFRRYEHSDSALLDRIIGKFAQSSGVLHGLVHLFAYQECYCPACVTRRSATKLGTVGGVA
jgi:hypothetical protein